MIWLWPLAVATFKSKLTSADKGWQYNPADSERCLDANVLGVSTPILQNAGGSGGLTVVVEENDWPSQRIVASAVAILAAELLGYNVVF